MVWFDDMLRGGCRRPSMSCLASALAQCMLRILLPPLLSAVLLDFDFGVNGQTEIQETFCNGRGLINSNLTCSCFSGFRGPDCSLSELRHRTPVTTTQTVLCAPVEPRMLRQRRRQYSYTESPKQHCGKTNVFSAAECYKPVQQYNDTAVFVGVACIL